MNKPNNYFTTNQSLTLKNLHEGRRKISMKTPVNKKVCKELLYIIDI